MFTRTVSYQLKSTLTCKSSVAGEMSYSLVTIEEGARVLDPFGVFSHMFSSSTSTVRSSIFAVSSCAIPHLLTSIWACSCCSSSLARACCLHSLKALMTLLGRWSSTIPLSATITQRSSLWIQVAFTFGRLHNESQLQDETEVLCVLISTTDYSSCLGSYWYTIYNCFSIFHHWKFYTV